MSNTRGDGQPTEASLAAGNPRADRIGRWELTVGWTAGGILGLLQGIALLGNMYDWGSRIAILPLAFLVHSTPIALLGLLFSLGDHRLRRLAGLHTNRAGAPAPFLSLLVFIPVAVYIHAVRLPGVSLFDPVALSLTAGLALFCLALIPLWRVILRRWLGAFVSRGRSITRWFLQWYAAPLIALVFIAIMIPRITGSLVKPDGSAARGGALRPNLAILVLDTMRSDRLSCYGCPRPTSPFLETLAEGGVLFEEAISPAPWTLPSHASILTARFPRSHGAHMQHWRLSDNNRTIAEILKEEGYATGGFVSNPFLSRTFNLDQGFDVYDDELEPWFFRTYIWKIAVRIGLDSMLNPRYADRKGDATAAVALRYLDSLGDDPWFLFVNFNDTHAPYDPPAEYRNLFLTEPDYNGPLLDPARHSDYVRIDDAGLGARDMTYLRDLYDGEIRYLDDVIGRLVPELEKRSAGRGLLLVVTGDHGEFFGEHDLVGHRGSLYNPVLSVPLIFSGEGIDVSAGRISSRVQTLDIVPTILDILDLPLPGKIDGRSLVPLWADSADPDSVSIRRECYAELFPEPGLIERYPYMDRRLTALYSGSWKLIRGDDGSLELYDVAVDPEESVDQMPAEAETGSGLHGMIDKWLEQEDAIQGDVSLDAATVERLRSLGYLR